MEPNIYHLHGHNPYTSSFSYPPNPNPNPNIPSASIGDGGVLRPPGVDHYPQYPAYSQTPIPTEAPAEAPPLAESYYYYGVPGGYPLHQQYAPQPDSFSYGNQSPSVPNTKKPKPLNWQERRKLKQQEDTQILAGLQSAIPESNVGFKMLKNMGYNPGSALGKDGIGRSEPVGLDIRRSREGIGARVEMNKVGTRKTFADLETKKLKVIQGGASANSVRVCTICNVVCNSDKVFASHVAGEKHALKAIGVSPGALKSKVPSHLKALHSTKLTPNTVAKTAAKGLVTYVPSSYCDVCKIDCNSQEVLNSHKMGKKHIKNMQKLQASITPKPPGVPSSIIPPVLQKEDALLVAGQAKSVAEQPKAPPTKEDLEIKKQKVLNGGAVADRVRVCEICNVVCNSETVFSSHIAGQMHIAQVNKKQ